MAITVAQVIQFDDANVVADHTKSSISTTAGNRLIIALIDRGPSGGRITSITDTGSNSWSRIVEATGATPFVEASIWSTNNNAAAITSYTLHGDNTATIQSTFFEATGTDNVTDVTHTGTGSSTSISSGSAAPPHANGLVIGVGGVGLLFADATFSSTAFTTGGGTFQTRTARSGLIQCATGDLIQSGGSSTPQTFSFTSSASAEWASVIAIFPSFVPPGNPTFNNYQFAKCASSGMWLGERIK